MLDYFIISVIKSICGKLNLDRNVSSHHFRQKLVFTDTLYYLPQQLLFVSIFTPPIPILGCHFVMIIMPYITIYSSIFSSALNLNYKGVKSADVL